MGMELLRDLISLISLMSGLGGLRNIGALVKLLPHHKPSMLLKLLGDSEDIDRLLQNRESERYSFVEKVVDYTDQNRRASDLDKAAAHIYKLQQNAETDKVIQILEETVDHWRDINNEIAAEMYFSIGYLCINRGIGGELAVYDNPDAVAKAILNFDAAIRLNPDYAKPYCYRGKVKAYQDDYESAIADYNKAIELEDQYAEAYCGRGDVKRSQGDYAGAITDYNAAIGLNSYLAEAYYGRGQVKRSQGDYAGAITDYNAAIRLTPYFIEAYNKRGIAKEQLGNYEAAITDFDALIYLKPFFLPKFM